MIIDTSLIQIFIPLQNESSDITPRFVKFQKGDVIANDEKVSLIKKRSPNGSNSIVRIGNSNCYAYTERMSYTFIVTEETSLIQYYYAMVLQDPGHGTRPYFYAEVSRKNALIGEAPIACSNTTYIAHNASFQGLKLVNNCYYKDWSSNLIDLSDYIGEEVTLSFVTSDCGQDGHFGYAYVDAEFVNSKFEIEGGGSNAVCVGDSVTFRYPGAETFTGETYEWKVGDNIVSTESSMSHTFSQSGDYVVSLTISVDGGNTCIQARTMTETIHVMNCICPDNGKITIDGVSVDESFSVCKDQLLRIGFQTGIPAS